MTNNLKFTFSIPTFNSCSFIKQCLDSIVNQDYPKDLIEIIVTDAGSSDKTLEIAKTYTDKIFENKLKLGEYGTKIAAGHASGDLFVVFAADNELVQRDWLKSVSELFLKHKDLACFWCKLKAARNDPPINKYYELIQSEPLAWFLNKNLDSYLSKTKSLFLSNREFKMFSVDKEKPLCWGANGLVYRLDFVKDIYHTQTDYVGDNETFHFMVENGRNQVIYMPSLGVYHHTVSSVVNWVGKWKRNYVNIFLKTQSKRKINWFFIPDFKTRMFLWLLYSLIPIFSLTHTLYLMTRDKSLYWIYHPLMSFLQTCTYIFWTFRISEGRNFLIKKLFLRA